MAGLPLRLFAADNLQLHEQEIKAGLLYNFLKYTEWPALSSSMVVCVFGEDPFEGYLQPIAGRSVNQKEITLYFVHSIADTNTCNLLFVNADKKAQWPQLKKTLVNKSILTVSDFEGFAESGGMIEFGRKDDHISVNLNMNAVTNARLHVQGRLLRLVTIVTPSSPGGG